MLSWISLAGQKVEMYSLSWTIRIVLLAALVGAGLVLGAPSAKSQPAFCGERYSVLEQLKRQYDEKRTAFGITGDGRLLEVLASPSGSWTILVSRPGGWTCILGSGEGWQQTDPAPDDPVA